MIEKATIQGAVVGGASLTIENGSYADISHFLWDD